MDNAASFSVIAPILAQNHYYVIAPDLLGFGKSDHLKDFHSNHHIVHVIMVYFVVEALDLNNLIVMGHSLVF